MWLVGLNLGAFKINKVGLYSIDTKREREREGEKREILTKERRETTRAPLGRAICSFSSTYMKQTP